MMWTLANAAAVNSPGSNVELVLISFGVLVVIAVIAGVPILIARGHRSKETIIAIIVIWALISVGSINYCVLQQMNWSAEQERRIESGYYDPQNVSDKPTEPFLLWTGLAVTYVAVLFWATTKSANQSSNPGDL